MLFWLFVPNFILNFPLLVSNAWGENLEAILSLPFEPNQVGPVKGFSAFGGEWRIEESSSGEPFLQTPSGSGPRLVWNSRGEGEKERVVFSSELFLAKGSGGNAALVLNDSLDGIGADAFNGYEFAFYAREQYVMIGRHEQNFRMLGTMKCFIPQDEWFRGTAEAERVSEGIRLRIFINGKLVHEILDPNPLPAGEPAIRPWQRQFRARNLTLNGKKIVLEKPRASTFEYPETLSVEGLPPVLLISRPAFRRPPAVGQDFWTAASTPEKGCALKIIEPADPKKEVRTIFSDPEGQIYDANLSFDAQTIYFTYRPAREIAWKIFRIGIDGQGLKQLTFGNAHDFSPAELPDGGIIFVSSRRGGFTLCQPGAVSNLYRMNADGSGIRCVSMNTLSDFCPQVLPDGRVLFTRWEYVDRDLTYRQSLWTQNPDGTNYQLYFGNTVRHAGSILHARPLPGSSSELVATLAPHHGFPQGAVALIHRNFGPESEVGNGCEYLTKEYFPVGDRSDSEAFRDPFPLSKEQFLCAGGMKRDGLARCRIYLMNRKGEKRLLYEDPDPLRHAVCPIPIRSTPRPPQIASQPGIEDFLPVSRSFDSDLSPAPDISHSFKLSPDIASRLDSPILQSGTLLLVDVYEGLEPWVKRGEAVKLRVMEQVRKSEELGKRAFDQSPVMSYGTYYAKRCWGEVPIEEDGSAYFEAPAGREIYRQVLDREGRELQRMTSALQLMPGQRTSCVGCHENRQSAPVSLKRSQPLAAGRAPSVPKMPHWWSEIPAMNPLSDPRIVNYVTLVQPVWDRHCAECHSGKAPAGGYDLSGGATRYFNMSYDNLLGRSRSYRQHDMLSGRLLEKEKEREKPLVHFFWLLFTPSGVNQPRETGVVASRLDDFLTKEHCGHEIPLADRQRVYLWADANVPYYATYANSRPETSGKRDLWDDEWFKRDYLEVYARRCAQCHREYFFNDTPTGNANPTTCWNGRFAWINLSVPENSPALTAHLPKPLGRGISIHPKGSPVKFLFEDERDPDYLKMLHAIQVGKEKMIAQPRADQAGFRFAKPEN